MVAYVVDVVEVSVLVAVVTVVVVVLVVVVFAVLLFTVYLTVFVYILFEPEPELLELVLVQLPRVGVIIVEIELVVETVVALA